MMQNIQRLDTIGHHYVTCKIVPEAAGILGILSLSL